MAKGRMISKGLWGSEKFSDLVASDDGGAFAGLLYIAILSGTNVDGRLEVDRDSLLDLLARTGRKCGLDVAGLLQRWREAIENVGLIRTWQADGRLMAEVVDFHRHNRVRKDREAPSALPPAPWDDQEVATPGVRREDSGSTPGGLRVKAKAKAKAKANESERQSKEPPAPPDLPSEDEPEECPDPWPENTASHERLERPPEKRASTQPLRAFLDTQLARVTTKEAPEPQEPDPEENVAHSASLAVCPIVLTDGGVNMLRHRLAKLYVLPEVDARVQQDANAWGVDLFTLNAAVQLLDRFDDPKERKRIDSPVAFMRKCVPARAEELKSKRHTHIENSLDRQEKARHDEAFNRPRAYDPKE